MAKATTTEAEMVLDRFVETVFRLMLEHHQRHVLELELTVPQAQALRVLRRGALCTRDLASALEISAPAVTQLTDRLARKRLIERRVADGDRRSVMLALTDKGRRAVDHFRQSRNGIFSGALLRLSDADRAMVVTAMSKVVTALEEYVSDMKESQSRAEIRTEEQDGEVTRSKTAVQPAMASNTIEQARPVQADRKIRMEWD
ncbi:MAG TPA: MarR family transcriptional regulator [Blastocatellia bacterium]|nr:MarR family transcriptional regulator [Blastocatellia bacterium]